MRCAIYMRKSVDRDKAERSVSIESQKAAVLEWAVEHGATVLPEWIVDDRDYSGSTDNRPGFQRIVEAVESGAAPFDTILIHNMDRLFRSVEYQAYYIVKFRKRGVHVVSVSEENEDPFIRVIKSAANENERTKTRERVVRAMKDIAGRGLSCGGTAPYGYRVKRMQGVGRPVVWAIDPDRASVVQRIYTDYVGGASYETITRALNAEGVEPPRTGTRRGRNAKPGWRMTGLRSILVNETYTGTRIYNKTKKVSRRPTRQVHRPPEEWIRVPDAHCAIIDRDTWHRAQEVRGTRAAQITKGGAGSQGSLRQKYLPSGHLFCGHCDGSMSIRCTRHGTTYYGCTQAKQGLCDDPPGLVRLDALEMLITKLMQEALAEPDNYSELLTYIEDELRIAQTQMDHTGVEAERARLEDELRDAKEQKANLVEFLCGAGRSEFAGVRSKLRELARRTEEIARRLVELAAFATPAGTLTAEEIAAELAVPEFDVLNNADKRQLMDALSLEIRVQREGKRKVVDVRVAPESLVAGAVDRGCRTIGAGSGI